MILRAFPALLSITLALVVLPRTAAACRCDDGFSPAGDGPDAQLTEAATELLDQFAGHTYCASVDGAVPLYKGCSPGAAGGGAVVPRISARDPVVARGQSTRISWSSVNAGNCEFFLQSGANRNTTISQALQGSYDTGPLNVTTTYQLNCATNQTSPWKTVTVVVSVDPSRTAPAAATSTGNTTAVEMFTSAVSTSVSTAAIHNVATAADGGQTSSLASANEVSAIGAGQAATIGALFCAQGANTQLESPADSAEYYSRCQQSYDTAKALGGKDGAYRRDEAALAGDPARQTLSDFEKNFGVSPGDFLGRMLGAGAGPSSLGEMIGGKIKEADLAAALEASGKAPAGDLTGEKFAVDLAGAPKGKAANGVRDALKAKLDKTAQESESRRPASGARAHKAAGDNSLLEGLAPLTGGIFEQKAEVSKELSLFDVVHLRYEKLAPRLHPPKKLTP